MMETIVVERVGKFGPQANGKWFGVKRPLKASDFVAGVSYNVELEEWNNGSKSGMNIVSVSKAEKNKTVEQKKETLETIAKISQIPAVYKDYQETKDRRILVQGLTQAVAQSPLLAGLPFTNSDEAISLIKEVSLALIEFVLENSK